MSATQPATQDAPKSSVDRLMVRIRAYAATLVDRLPQLVVVAIGILGCAVLGLGIARWFKVDDSEYWAQAVPSFLAIVAGIPLAVWLLTWEQAATKAREGEAAQSRKRLVLEVIRGELCDDRRDLVTWRAARPRQIFTPHLKTEAWRALADGGELASIEDPELIGQLARAYHWLEATTQLERTALAYWYDPVLIGFNWLGKQQGKRPPRYVELTDTLGRQDDVVVSAIDDALAAIAASIGPASGGPCSDETPPSSTEQLAQGA